MRNDWRKRRATKDRAASRRLPSIRRLAFFACGDLLGPRAEMELLLTLHSKGSHLTLERRLRHQYQISRI